MAPACPLCVGVDAHLHARAKDIEYRTTDEEFAWYACPRCDILFIAPMLHGRLGEIYPANYYSFASAKKTTVVRVKEALDRRNFRQLLSRIPGESLSVLDIGGGSGWLLDMVRAADKRVSETCVVDLGAEAGEMARAAGHSYVQGRVEEVDLPDRFDLILMLNLIEHVVDPRAVLAKARRWLKPGGRLLIKTPNFDALDARIFRHRSWAGYHTPRHFVLFRKESLEHLVRECGFSVARFSHTQGAPFWSVSLLEELRRLGLVRITAQRPAVYHPLIPLLQIAGAAFDFMRRPFSRTSQMEFELCFADEI